MADKAKVLFLCTGNSCRSQIAEGFLRHLGGERFEAHSAGIKPVPIDPNAVAVMREIGIDISGQASKHVASFDGKRFSYVITVCDSAKESCPVFPGNCKRLHWSFPDPASTSGPIERRLAVFRRVRDEIRTQVTDFIDATKAARE